MLKNELCIRHQEKHWTLYSSPLRFDWDHQNRSGQCLLDGNSSMTNHELAIHKLIIRTEDNSNTRQFTN